MQLSTRLDPQNAIIYRLAARKGETFRFVQSSLFPDSILQSIAVLSKDYDEFIIEKHEKNGISRIDIACLQSLI